MFGKHGGKYGGFVGLTSLIGVTFLLIATVIGVTVVKNRGITLNPSKMAEDVYPSPTGGACSGSCYYGPSACSSLGLQNGSGSCTGGICCGAPLTNNCTNGDSYCVDINTVGVCKVDKSGYTETDCASGSTCDSVQKKCVSSSAPTPTPTPASGACAGQCFWGISACSTVSRYSSTGTCSGTSICCGNVFSANNCTNGDSYCVDSNTVGVCKTDKSGYTNTDCASGSKCDFNLKKCTGGSDCAGTSQSCSNRACCNSSDVCAAMPGGSFCVAKGDCTSGDTKCVAEGLTSFVYRCGSNGYWQKERACDFGCSGTSCKSACNPGDKRCSGDELEICNSTGTAWTGQSCVNGCTGSNETASCKIASCEASVCNNQCAQQTPGYIGTCSAGVCHCQMASMYNSFSGPTINPSEEWVQGTAACMNNPEGDECKEWNKQLITEGATVIAVTIGAPALVASGITSGIGLNLYSSAMKLAATSLGQQLMTATALVNVIDDSGQIFECIRTQDENDCMWAAIALTSPIPGASYGDDITDLVYNLQAKGISINGKSFNQIRQLMNDEYSFEALKSVNNAYLNYGQTFRNALQTNNPTEVLKIAQNYGYSPKYVNLGTPVQVREGGEWVTLPLTKDNSVRMGPNKELYIGVNKNGSIDIEDLCHDVGACVMGGKVNNSPKSVSLEALQLTNYNSRRQITPNSEIRRVIGTTKTSRGEMVPKTWLLDALVRGEYNYQYLKYLP